MENICITGLNCWVLGVFSTCFSSCRHFLTRLCSISLRKMELTDCYMWYLITHELVISWLEYYNGTALEDYPEASSGPEYSAVDNKGHALLCLCNTSTLQAPVALVITYISCTLGSGYCLAPIISAQLVQSGMLWVPSIKQNFPEVPLKVSFYVTVFVHWNKVPPQDSANFQLKLLLL